jgi:hypothetical protein
MRKLQRIKKEKSYQWDGVHIELKEAGRYALSINQYAEESQTRNGQVQNYSILLATTEEHPYLFTTKNCRSHNKIAAVKQSNKSGF